MGTFHFLNVRNGDCSIIQHPSGHTTVIDVYNASSEALSEAQAIDAVVALDESRGNFNQKAFPVNLISYLKKFGISSIFRFILTHPDMDHIGGIEDLFNEFSPANFWDTDNACVKDDFGNGGPHDEQDWLFYKALRDNRPTESPKRLVLYSGKRGKYYNQAEDGSGGGDGIYILSPTKELMKAAIESDDYNDFSYVLVYKSNGGRIIVAGDSHDATWEHILANHYNDVANAEVLLAPHHGRKSNRTYQFLDVVKPKITLFGNANHEHLAYGLGTHVNCNS